VRYWFFILAFVVSSISVVGQLRFDQDDFLELEKEGALKKHYIKVEGMYYGYSDAVTNDLMNRTTSSTHIGNETKEDVYKRLDDDNVLGSEVMGSISYKQKVGDGNVSFRLRDRTVSYSYFNEEFFRLFTGGNKQYEGQSVEISPYEYFKLSYLGAYIGYETKVNDNWRVGGGLSYLRSLGSRSISMDNAHFYTAPYGEYVELRGEFKAHDSGKEGSRYERNYGNGFGVDFFVSHDFSKGNKLSFSVEDLGVIFTSTFDSYYDVDTSVTFEGVNITDGFQVADGSSNTFGVSTDIEEMLGLTAEPNQVTYVVPAIFHLNYYHPLSESISIEGGIRYLLMAHKIPQFYARGNFRIKKFLMVSPVFAYGGFSSFDLGLSLGTTIGDFMSINLDLFYIESLVLPSSSSTQGLGLTISSYF